MVIDYKNQELIKELNFWVNKERVYVGGRTKFEGDIFRNFPAITSQDTTFVNCTFENCRIVKISRCIAENCVFQNVSNTQSHQTKFKECSFIHCYSQGPLLIINAGEINRCTFETITSFTDDGYIVYSIYEKKSKVKSIKNCRFVDCHVENKANGLTHCVYFKPLSSRKTISIDNVDYDTCIFENCMN